MTKNDALLYAADRIRVNSVHPGFIWTPLVANLADESAQGAEAFRKALDAKHPLGHIGTPAQAALTKRALAWLKPLIARTAAVINGVKPCEGSGTQAAIDALFDR